MFFANPILAPWRAHCRAAVRRVAGGALPVRGRGGRRLAGDMHRRGDASEGTLPKATRRARKRVRSPHHGGLQRFERVGVEEKINKTDVRDAAVVVGSGLERVVGYHHLFEGIASVAKREGLLFPLLGGGDGVCGLDVHLPRTAIDDEIDFVLSYRVLPGGVVVALHNADINGISTPDEFVVDGVFHEVREFRLAEVDARVPESGIGGVVFHRVVEVAAPLDVKALCLADKKGIGKVVKVLDDGVSARIDSGNGFCGVGEFGRVCERGGVAHHDVDHLLQEQIVPDVVSFHDVAEINGCVKIFKVRLFCRRRLGEDAVWEASVEQIFLDYLEGIPFGCAKRHELGKGQRCNLYHMPSASELRRDVGGEQPGIGASHIDIDIWGRSQPVQNTIEVHKHPLAVVRMDSGKVNSFRKGLAAVLNLVNEYIVHLPVGNKLGTNVAVEFDWIDKIGGYGMFKVDFNDVVGRHSVFQKMGFEYAEKQIALAATPDAGKNLYKAVVFCLGEAIQEVMPLDRHFRCSVHMFMLFFIKMSVVYHKTCPVSRGMVALFDSLLKTIIKMSIAEGASIVAPCRTHRRAAFRRVAGGVLPMRRRGEAAVARDARPWGELKRTRGANKKTNVADRDDFRDVLFYAVDNAVVAEKCLANVLAAEFLDNAAGKREILKMGNGTEYGIFPFPCRRPVAALLCDVANALRTAQFPALGPADHNPSFLLIRSRSACASRISSSCVVNSPRSSSASADQRSSKSSSVSRMLSKSATSMITFEAMPFCVMSSGRRVLVLRLKHSAIVLRKVEKVTTSSARRIVFMVRSSTGIVNPTCGLKECWYCTTCCTLMSSGETLEILWVSPRNFKWGVVLAPCRAHRRAVSRRAVFRRVAGGALPMRGRGEAAVAGRPPYQDLKG